MPLPPAPNLPLTYISIRQPLARKPVMHAPARPTDAQYQMATAEAARPAAIAPAGSTEAVWGSAGRRRAKPRQPGRLRLRLLPSW